MGPTRCRATPPLNQSADEEDEEEEAPRSHEEEGDPGIRTIRRALLRLKPEWHRFLRHVTSRDEVDPAQGKKIAKIVDV